MLLYCVAGLAFLGTAALKVMEASANESEEKSIITSEGSLIHWSSILAGR